MDCSYYLKPRKINLVIHIGMPKTATTSFQKALASYPGYVGRNGVQGGYTNALLKIFNSYVGGKNVEHKLLKWAKSLAVYAENESLDGPIIVSDELFFASEFNGMIEFPLVLNSKNVKNQGCTPKIAGFLLLIDEVCECYISSLSCVLSIRNQIDWLFSKYSEASLKIRKPSMNDFVDKIYKFASQEDPSWCNWFWWVDALDNAIGRERVHVLLMEEISEENFSDEFISAFGIGKVDYNVRFSHSNRKKQNGESWIIRKFDPAASYVKRKGLVPGTLSYIVFFRLIRFFCFFSLNKEALSLPYIDPDIYAKNLIAEECAFSNACLAKRLEKDLEKYGYPF